MSESKKVVLIILLLVLATLAGFYNRFDQSTIPSTSSVSVLPKPPSVMVIPIEGFIMFGGSEWQPSLVDTVATQLEIAAETKSIKAIVLRINSPGGTIGASQDIYQSIMRFKEKTKKPVVASILEIGASGGYWVACAGDHIFSYPGSIVGSIGVIANTMDFTKVPDRYGIGVRRYKSVKYKDLLSSWREPYRQEKLMVQRMLDSSHRQFVRLVKKQRNLTNDQVKNVSNGSIYTGEDATIEGLVDEIGTLYDAINHAGSLGGISGEPNVVYPSSNLKDFFQSFQSMFDPMSFFTRLIVHPAFNSLN